MKLQTKISWLLFMAHGVEGFMPPKLPRTVFQRDRTARATSSQPG